MKMLGSLIICFGTFSYVSPAVAQDCLDADSRLRVESLNFKEAQDALTSSYGICPDRLAPRACNAFYQDAFESAQRRLHEAASARMKICAFNESSR